MGIVLEAFLKTHVLEAAHALLDVHISVIPIRSRDKKPAISWDAYQNVRANHAGVDSWYKNGLLGNVGIVMGDISRNLVCIDLDGQDAVKTFYKAFPDLFHSTMTILSGSHEGRHLYFFSEKLPATTRCKDAIGGFELRANGCYMVAPPSIHPSGKHYETRGVRPIAVVDNLDDVQAWIRNRIASKHEGQKVEALQELRRKRYMESLVNNLMVQMSRASEGSRNDTLFNCAIQLYQRVAANELSESTVNDLANVALSKGLERSEIEKTLESARLRGMSEPRPFEV